MAHSSSSSSSFVRAHFERMIREAQDPSAPSLRPPTAGPTSRRTFGPDLAVVAASSGFSRTGPFGRRMELMSPLFMASCRQKLTALQKLPLLLTRSLVLARSSPLELAPCFSYHYYYCYAPGAPRQCWFGGGTDLTPAYIFKEDVKHFHSVKRKKSELIVVETRATWRAANDLYSGKWESLQVNQLLDFGFVGYAYTWSNNQVGEANIQERLDRAVAIINWKEAFLEGVVKHFQRYRSDHCPILIDVHGESLKRKRPYIFRSEECGLETLNAKRLSKEAGL
ncbi:hypothetical protein Ahy_A07g034671 [Arachis hypogaea]|uniref:Uncharacterized protein n=1 Tax=Arachis hypogaea TaxID=3818 RepID=A0A445CCG9_ARAHY|nr:hypothetical protein Ahy_A07g034671 [Arachis hypogaea]